MRCVITGGRGFAGAYLQRELLDAGHDVHLLDRADGFDVCDWELVHHTFASLRPEIIYHLAAFTHVGESWGAAVDVWRVNAEGTLNILEAAADCSARRVLVVGSAEEYGRVDPSIGRVSEKTELRPVTPYGVSKVAADYLALQAWLGTGLETVRVRPFNHTGAGQLARFVVPALAARVAHAEHLGESKIVVGNLDPVRELLDVRDVVRAYRLLAEDGEPGDVYNVCAGVGYRVGEIADALLALADRPLELEVDPALVRPVDVPRLIGDGSKLAATGWAPRFELDDTLRAVLDAARRGL
jgi:GDP-4-dehydro-6-deoxy-D-mannose reductase